MEVAADENRAEGEFRILRSKFIIIIIIIIIIILHSVKFRFGTSRPTVYRRLGQYFEQ